MSGSMLSVRISRRFSLIVTHGHLQFESVFAAHLIVLISKLISLDISAMLHSCAY